MKCGKTLQSRQYRYCSRQCLRQKGEQQKLRKYTAQVAIKDLLRNADTMCECVNKPHKREVLGKLARAVDIVYGADESGRKT
jgi:uroporphyrinogen-III decarboxylase